VRRCACLLLVSLALASPGVTFAQGEDAPARPRLISPARRTAAIAAAIVPGFVVHGMGSWIVGERGTAKRLAIAELGAVALIAAGGIPLFATHGSRRIAGATIPLALSGTAFLTTGWLADIWTATGAPHHAGAPRAPVPWEVELGATYVSDPLFAENAYTRLAGAVRLGYLTLAPSALIAVDGDAQRASLDAAWRLAGSPADGTVQVDGSRVEIRAAVRGNRQGNDGYSTITGELAGHGRLDLEAVSPAIAGAFAELTLGFGLETTRYEAGALNTHDLFLGRFGFGAYLGHGRGEASVWYDHRRDQLAGGIAASRAAGFVGSVGTTVDVTVSGPWQVGAELQLGAAWLATLAVRYRGGLP
jgi:hypothetical protein